LGPVTDYKDFLLSNGRLALKEGMLQEETYQVLLTHFFQKFTSVHLNDLFPNFFEEFHQFDVSDHSSIGQLTDEVANLALNRKFNPVTLRTFIDHLIYYFTYLRQAGLAHAPFEFECGFKEDTCVIEVHVTMRNFVAEYLMDSFGSINSHDPLQFLLSIVQKSCQFLHINYIESSGKLIFIGVWQKNIPQFSGNIAFQNILSTEQTLAVLENKIHEYKEVDTDLEPIANEKLPGNIIEMVISPDKNSFLGKNDKEA